VRTGEQMFVWLPAIGGSFSPAPELERNNVLLRCLSTFCVPSSVPQLTSTSKIFCASNRVLSSPLILIDLKRCSGVCLILSFATADAPASSSTRATAGLPAMWSGVWPCFVEVMLTLQPFSISQRTHSSFPASLAACSDECPTPPLSTAFTWYSTSSSSSSRRISPLAAARSIF
jgi:hypothetical protein